MASGCCNQDQITDTVGAEVSFLSNNSKSSFLEGVEAVVKVLSAESVSETRRLRYQIFVKHGDFTWSLDKSVTDIIDLQRAIRLYEFSQRCRCTSRSENLHENAQHLPEFNVSFFTLLLPYKEKLISERIMEKIEYYLNELLSIEKYRRQQHVINFFEISRFSFDYKLGNKGKEGFLYKRSSLCILENALWKKRWFILKSNVLIYLDQDKENVEGVFIIDAKTTISQKRVLLVLTNSSHRIYLDCPTVYHAIVWRTCFEREIYESVVQYGIIESNHIRSFAPVRKSFAHWFIDGRDYFAAVADALESARQEIFISGWFLSPYVYMKREPEFDDRWMLKSILEKKADEGIKVFVFIYDGPDGFIKLADKLTETTLESLNKNNIQVIRHRGHGIGRNIFWSHHEKLVIVDQYIAFVSGLDLARGRWDFDKHPLTDLAKVATTQEMKKQAKKGKVRVENGQLWPGNDYANDYVKSKVNFKKPFKDHIDRQKVPRAPWHDIACVTYGLAAQDVARHFIQKWNFVKGTKKRNDDEIPFLVPFASSAIEYCAGRHEHLFGATISAVQVLRSSSKWSVGIQETERSIVEAYVKAINEAEHYIYIENQFFISNADQRVVKNEIVAALVNRILRAEANNETFRVYIVLPLIPMFEGDFSKAKKSLQIQMFAHYQYHSISRGESSLIGFLQQSLPIDRINRYVCFSSLRTHGELDNQFITEVVYVHSKLMIVDDQLAIIGSANLNDRSLLGDRDTEMVLCIRDIDLVDSVMGGRPYRVGKFSSTLRKALFAEHLGFPKENPSSLLDDIVCDEFYHRVWKSIARSNTAIYDQVFRSIPTDAVKRFSQVKKYQNQSQEKMRSQQQLRQISGYLVEFPMQYLENEKLERDPIKLLPVEIFT